MKLILTEKHLNASLAVPWGTETCLLAQAAKEVFNKPLYCGKGSIHIEGSEGKDSITCVGAVKYQALFDDGLRGKGDEKAIETLRNMLPVEVELKLA